MRTPTTVSLAVVTVLAAASLVAVPAPAAHADPGVRPGTLVCPDLGSVPIDLRGDPVRGGRVRLGRPARSASSRGPGLHVPPGRQPSAAVPVASPTLSCTGPGGDGYVVESVAGSPASSAVAPQAPSAAARAQAAATATFPFQAELAAYLAGRPGSVTVAAQGLGGPVLGYTKGDGNERHRQHRQGAGHGHGDASGAGARAAACSAWEKSKVVPMIRTSDNAATSALWSYVGGGSRSRPGRPVAGADRDDRQHDRVVGPDRHHRPGQRDPDEPLRLSPTAVLSTCQPGLWARA